MSLSAVRVLAGPLGVHELLNRACRPRADRRLLNVVCCGRGPENPRQALCGTSNNSANPIQRETRILSRYLCSPVSQTQPSVRKLVRCQCFAGTQENTGSKSPSCGRQYVKSRLKLPVVSVEKMSCREALQRGSSGETPDPSEEVQAGARQVQAASVEAIYVAPNGVNCSMREIEKSGFVRLLSTDHHQRNRGNS